MLITPYSSAQCNINTQKNNSRRIAFSHNSDIAETKKENQFKDGELFLSMQKYFAFVKKDINLQLAEKLKPFLDKNPNTNLIIKSPGYSVEAANLEFNVKNDAKDNFILEIKDGKNTKTYPFQNGKISSCTKIGQDISIDSAYSLLTKSENVDNKDFCKAVQSRALKSLENYSDMEPAKGAKTIIALLLSVKNDSEHDIKKLEHICLKNTEVLTKMFSDRYSNFTKKELKNKFGKDYSEVDSPDYQEKLHAFNIYDPDTKNKIAQCTYTKCRDGKLYYYEQYEKPKFGYSQWHCDVYDMSNNKYEIRKSGIKSNLKGIGSVYLDILGNGNMNLKIGLLPDRPDGIDRYKDSFQFDSKGQLVLHHTELDNQRKQKRSTKLRTK